MNKHAVIAFFMAVLTLSALPAAGQSGCRLEGTVKVIDDSPTYDANFPTIAAAGPNWAVTNSQFDGVAGAIVLTLLDASGTITSGPTAISDPGTDADIPSLAWSGTQYMACWDDYRDKGYPESNIYATRASAAGAKTGADVRVADTAAPSVSEESSIAHNPIDDEFAIVWDDTRNAGITDAYFRRVDAAGVVLDPEQKTSGGWTYSLSPDLAWNGSGFGVVWIDGRNGEDELFFSRVDLQGASYTGDVMITQAALYSSTPSGPDFAVPSIAWNGTMFGVAFVDDRDGNPEVYFIGINPDGTLATASVRVTNDANVSTIPDVAWDGSDFRIAYTDDRFGTTSIMMSMVSTAGVEVIDDSRLLDINGAVAQLNLAWSGSALGLTWSDDEPGYFRVRFSLVGCDNVTAVTWASYGALTAERGTHVYWSTLAEIGTLAFRVVAAPDRDTAPVPVGPLVPAAGPGFPYSYTHKAGTAATFYRIEELAASGAGSRTPLFAPSPAPGSGPPLALHSRPEPARMDATVTASDDGVVVAWTQPPDVTVDACRLWMRNRAGGRAVPIGALAKASSGEALTFTDRSGMALSGGRAEYRVVSSCDGAIVAMSDWLSNPIPQTTPTLDSRRSGRSRAGRGSPVSAPPPAERGTRSR